MVRRRAKLAVLLSIAGVLALAASAGARTKVVYAGGPAKWQGSLIRHSGAGVDNFLINRITINVGDTVDWNGASLSSGFHTVDIPKLNGEDLALITATGKTVEGVNDAAGNPFWFNGKVPVLSFNTALFGPSGPKAYNGTTRVDSGLPLKRHDFKVKFLTAGTYKYFCDVHHGMQGVVIVKPKGAAVPSAAQDAATLRSEEQHYAAEAKRVDRTKTHGSTVSVGASGPGGLEVFAMFPAVLHIKVGTTVKFMMSKDSREVHTASFGPAKYLSALSRTITGAPAPSPAALYPSDPPGHIQLSASSHGNGFASIGLMDRDATTPLPALGAITFTRAGTYRYQCLIHPFMRGTIVVK